MDKKTTKIVALAVAGIIILLLLIKLVTGSGKEPTTTPAAQPNTTAGSILTQGQNIANNKGILGTWYSNRPDADILEFKENGYYASTKWLSSGSYLATQKTVILSMNDLEYVVNISKHKDQEVLVYEDYTYFRSLEQANISRLEKENKQSEINEMYRASVKQILNTEPWVSDTGDIGGTTILKWTDDEYSATWKSSIYGTEQTSTGKVKIKDIKVEPNLITLISDMELTYSDASTATIRNEKITIKIDKNKYTLMSYALPYPMQFTKTVDIVFTQPNTTTTQPNPATKPAVTTTPATKPAVTTTPVTQPVTTTKTN